MEIDLRNIFIQDIGKVYIKMIYSIPICTIKYKHDKGRTVGV